MGNHCVVFENSQGSWFFYKQFFVWFLLSTCKCQVHNLEDQHVLSILIPHYIKDVIIFAYWENLYSKTIWFISPHKSLSCWNNYQILFYYHYSTSILFSNHASKLHIFVCFLVGIFFSAYCGLSTMLGLHNQTTNSISSVWTSSIITDKNVAMLSR